MPLTPSPGNDSPPGRLPVLIVGGGLSGLVAALRLHGRRIAFRLVEARDRLGGRILTVDAEEKPAADGFDLGPSWFWPQMHGVMALLAQDLAVSAFPQASEGAMLFQRSREGRPERYPSMRQQPVSMRVAGGTAALIGALGRRFPPDSIALGEQATHLVRDPEGVTVHVRRADGSRRRYEAAHVICTLPPRLLATSVTFDPAPEAAILNLWKATPTWMAPHAKFFALYDRPFWREDGLSGMAQSAVGPLVEIHDATTASGRPALFGFVGVPATHRAEAGREAVTDAALRQLGQLFGPEALSPQATLYKDWAADPLTATTLDMQAGDHPTPVHGPWVDAAWSGALTLAGSETSPAYPGYLAGAVDAGERAAASAASAARCLAVSSASANEV